MNIDNLELSTEWPKWFYTADGDSAIFNEANDVPEGWEDHPSKFILKVVEVVPEGISQARADYTEVFGKNPSPSWDELRLNKMIAKKQDETSKKPEKQDF